MVSANKSDESHQYFLYQCQMPSGMFLRITNSIGTYKFQVKGTLNRNIPFNRWIIYGLTTREKTKNQFFFAKKMSGNLKLCPPKLSNSDPFAHFLWWVDAHFIVGGHTFYGGWTHVFWWVDVGCKRS